MYPRVGSLRRSALFPQLIVLEIKYCFILSAVAVVVLAVSERFLGPSTFLAGILFGLIVVAVVVTAIRYTDAVEARSILVRTVCLAAPAPERKPYEECRRVGQVNGPMTIHVPRSVSHEVGSANTNGSYENGHGVIDRGPGVGTPHSRSLGLAYGFRE